jgi:NAD(P)-dependent dehydrogenase (short-subunit alcohol dehydrogenase family)
MANFVVVGGSSGIGLSLALRLAKDDNRVWVLSRNTNEQLEAKGIEHIKWDVATEEFPIDRLPSEIQGLAYCPGSITLKPFHGLKQADFQKDLDINLFGAIKAIQALLSALKRANGSSVVLFSTVAARMGMPFHSSIAAAKGAIEGLSVSLAAELAPSNIRVNVIAPSLTNTALASRLLSTPEKVEAGGKRHPLGRVGEPEDISAMAAFLLGAESSWITGQILSVDGGISHINRG